MKIMLVSAYVLAGILACGVLGPSTRQTVVIPYKTVDAYPGSVSLDHDLDFIQSAMQSLASSMPEHVQLARDVFAQCEAARKLFAEQFKPFPGASVDFVLWIHRPAIEGSGKATPEQINQSFELAAGHILKERYDAVAFEGETCSPGVDANVFATEIWYRQESPMALTLRSCGIDTRSPRDVKEFFAANSQCGGMFSGHEKFYRLAQNSPVTFVNCISPEIDSLEFLVMSGLLQASAEQQVIDSLNRIRSEYALACVLKTMREKDLRRGVIVFGYRHEPDFRTLASKIGLQSRIYNATGMSWGSWNEVPSAVRLARD